MNSGKAQLIFVLAGISEARISGLLSDSKNSTKHGPLSINGNKVELVEKLAKKFNVLINSSFEENEAARYRKSIKTIFDKIKSDDS